MKNITRFLRDQSISAGSAVYNAANVDTIRLSVTGLSRAGKTVFMVSLISNLLAMGKGIGGKKFASLPLLANHLTDKSGACRLIGVEIEPSGLQLLPRFAYETFRDDLAKTNGASWPPFTDQPAMLTLRLLLEQPSGLVGWAKKQAFDGPRVIRLELLDYPGEWLVDLPLLEKTYDSWSAETLSLLRQETRTKFASDFLAFADALKPKGTDFEQVATHGFQLYKSVLKQCREQAGLSWLQPGRLLMPGPWGEAPFMHFFPWTGDPRPKPGSLGALLKDRFELYQHEIRRSFFDPHFSAFNRQVVLVDVLSALGAGRSSFEDTRYALSSISASYGRLIEGGFFGGRKIEHVAFAATKADHVPKLQRDHLRKTLEHMVMSGVSSPSTKAPRSFHAVCAVQCTSDATITQSGVPEPVVMAVPLGQTRQQPFRTPYLPAGAVSDAFWDYPYFKMPQLQPPSITAGDAHAIKQFGLDAVLISLLGDLL